MIKVFAHRGFKSKYPENTLLAFKKAIEIGCDGIEFDVQMTKDERLVIIHDETVDRTTDGQGLVKNLTYEEISRLNASHQSKERHGFNKIPLLTEYFEMVKDTGIISNIELKNSVFEYEGIEQKVYDLIMTYGLKDKVVISSFNHLSVLKMKQIDPVIKCGLLTADWLVDPGKYVKTAGIECFHPAVYGMSKIKVQEIQSYGVEVNVWMGSEYTDLEGLVNMGVDTIITDFPDKLKQILRDYSFQ